VVKGILTAADAFEAIKAGADGIVVLHQADLNASLSDPVT
jgi:hypothetical protein